MDQHAQVLLVLGVSVLLAAGRAGAEIARSLRAPPVAGELCAGIVLGPTVLGHLGLTDAIFPAAGPSRVALEGLRSLAVLFVVLVAGLEIDVGVLRRVRRVTLPAAAGSLLVPFALGFALATGAPELFGGPGKVPKVAFALFFGTALALSALPAITRILMDLKLLKTDVGLIVVASAMLDDIAGWLVFSVVLALAGGGSVPGHVAGTLAGILAFAAALLLVARPLLDRALPWLQSRPAGPVLALAPILVLGLLGGAAMQAMGAHAVIGAFLVGVAIRTEHLKEVVHTVAHQFVTHVFAPIYFASVGLRVDFAESFSPGLVLLVLAVATAGKFAGAGLGARLGGAPIPLALAVAAGLNARGAMGIVLAELALEAGVIERPLFTAIVLMAFLSSIAAGPLMQRFLAPPPARPNLRDLIGDRIVLPFEATTARAAIDALAQVIAPGAGLDARAVADAAWARESSLPTGLGLGVAVPHARLPGLTAPLVALGVSPHGIDFDAPDGLPARLVFLILTPAEAAAGELQILRDVAQAFGDDARRARLLEATTVDEVRAGL